MNRSPVFAKALVRNREELAFAIADTCIVTMMSRSGTAHSFDFFRLSWMALNYDRMARAAKVFDRHRNAVGYFYLVKEKPEATAGIQHLADLEAVADGIKHIRDKTHFHIDSTGVLDPKSVWKTANISERRFRRALLTATDVLDLMYQEEFGYKFAPPQFDTTNVKKAMRLVEEAGLTS